MLESKSLGLWMVQLSVLMSIYIHPHDIEEIFRIKKKFDQLPVPIQKFLAIELDAGRRTNCKGNGSTVPNWF
ncbi:hypothetical protein L211DRAFT_838184 [Terfezia boudieri ATCC MYA-4762]|uniref:Uncharacterized protein n=1 Tax=Terfezia boudieri ATCC MYA-4762 TaxID=1051890 RepID=A0A3N4M0A6_9PEZI|nr:hypothetical protein L211DRAFT_838184 [Terfezia boudieri ATCC MYA-4762]